MIDKVERFSDDIHGKLMTLDSRLNSLKLNSGLTWHFLQEKLGEIRGRCVENQQACDQARANLKQWFNDRESESPLTIHDWRKKRETSKLAERARDTEDQAANAMLIAESSIEEAERMILEAISARLDAESVGSNDDDDESAEVRQAVSRETKGNETTTRSVDIINEEHQLVGRVLSLLEEASARIRHGESPPIQFEQWANDFLVQFTNHCHHSKDAAALHSVAQTHDISSDGGPAGVMLAYHKQGRTLLERMQLAAVRQNHLGWSMAARDYTLLLQKQFQHENQLLHQMEQLCGSNDDRGDMAEIFRRVDLAKGVHALRQQFDSQIAQWEQRFQEPEVVLRT